MKRWKKILFGILAFILLFLLVGLFLPSRVQVRRTLESTARPERFYSRVAAVRRWPEWTAWTTARFPDMTMRFEGPESGVGAVLIAQGKSSGDGTVTITRADPGKGIGYDLDFEHGTQVFRGVVTLEATASGTLLSWSIETEMGWNPIKAWAGLILDRLMGPDMAEGLSKLKQAVESER